MQNVPPIWKGTFSQHVVESISKQNLRPSEILVISFQDECNTRQNAPLYMEVEQKFYKLAGIVKGNKSHAVAIVPTPDFKFKVCNDAEISNIDECTTNKVLMLVYTKERRESYDMNK